MTWFCFRTEPMREKTVDQLCRRNGVQSFLPIETKWARRGPKRLKTEVSLPMFPRYIFARLDDFLPDYMTVRGIKGVQGIVGFGGRPIPISNATMERLFSMPRSVRTNSTPVHKGFSIGDRVRITDGPFLGHVVDVSEIRGEHAKIALELFGTKTNADIPLVALEAA